MAAPDTVEVHTAVSGRTDGPAVVLSNSIGATLAMWEPQLAALEEHFRVIRYDTRGHGGSPAPAGPYTVEELSDDLLGVLDRYDIERAHVVGLSLGGITALRFAQRHPERLGRLAVLCTAARFEPRQNWLDRAAMVRADGLDALATGSMERWFTPEFAARNDLTPYVAMIAGNSAEGYAGCCEALADADARPGLGSIGAPTLAIAGEHDPATPPERLQAIADGIPDGRLVVVPQASHLANIEQSDAVTRALVPHLLGHTPVDPAPQEQS